ncbi:bifunctional demethylmenaquinone methyltransferase/2-methoxy-6-polyprenyl-1,4-benzoquinol methylase UbiE [Thiomonas sp.]|jgi:demethylmenaquinone methyltransferase/2-methoxy-6-polyprenyl-1,4-benzoquinol methylase|uniref:bifunctional demethylmenaquinone methyltransferase/2-methoxy-6-polyprenyl-1,4-benzoquinol methylase UbiE n=1 Tax=Thiomonas sp. TaxID=2047785 RepID=UPI00262A639A|nr:bifunctional demethylmenaquinone methyltransferase/2-methoxy-6-polyprenyl-1,4-benzoquinol methylase UbiE [Thiomonas sp.]
MTESRSASSTHFGYQQVSEEEKAARVRAVFDSVAPRYDLMNDLMSAGLHRAWKAFTVAVSGVRPGHRVLDVAAGTGDLSRAFARKVGDSGLVVMTDINGAMLRAGRDRLLDAGILLPTVLCDAEKLPFADAQFDLVSVAFGLRNMTHKDRALRDMQRVLKPGGKLLVLEFSKPWEPLRGLYDLYSFQVLPRLGRLVANDAQSYQYLAESIRMHPDQPTLAGMMRDAGFGHVDWYNLSAGIVALHIGEKF